MFSDGRYCVRNRRRWQRPGVRLSRARQEAVGGLLVAFRSLTVAALIGMLTPNPGLPIDVSLQADRAVLFRTLNEAW